MNYRELIAAAQLYADRNNIEISGSIDIFITMAEARMNRVLKTREQSARWYTPVVPFLEYYSMPLDYRGMRNLKLLVGIPSNNDNETVKMNYVPPESMDSVARTGAKGEVYFTIEANQLRIYPAQEVGCTLEMLYYQKVPNLTLENDTNWMSEEHPDIYLAGMVSEIEIFTKNYEVGKAWDDKMSRCIAELEESDVTEMTSGPQMIVKLG